MLEVYCFAHAAGKWQRVMRRAGSQEVVKFGPVLESTNGVGIWST